MFEKFPLRRFGGYIYERFRIIPRIDEFVFEAFQYISFNMFELTAESFSANRGQKTALSMRVEAFWINIERMYNAEGDKNRRKKEIFQLGFR